VPIRSRIAELLHQANALQGLMKMRGAVKAPLFSSYTFHHVCEVNADYAFDPNVADATPAQFRRWMEQIGSIATPVTIADLCDGLHGKPLPKNPVLITFDDGYLSNYTTALPILQSLGMPATFFIATDYIEKRELFWWECIAWMLRQSSKPTINMATTPSGTEIVLETKLPATLRLLQNHVKDTVNIDGAFCSFSRRPPTWSGTK
jgi:hypothetical protein